MGLAIVEHAQRFQRLPAVLPSQLHPGRHTAALRNGLVRPLPERLCNDVSEEDAGLGGAAGNAAEFLD